MKVFEGGERSGRLGVWRVDHSGIKSHDLRKAPSGGNKRSLSS
jgi:hypothetical protein